MYKLIVSDLDQTLLNDQHHVGRRNLDAIRKARELAVRYVPASGRGFMTIQGTLQELGVQDKEDEYLVSFNGGAITENKNNRILHLQGLSHEKADNLFRRGLDYDVCTHVYTVNTVYVHNLTQDEKDFVDGLMEVEEFFDRDLDFLKGQQIVKVLYTRPDYGYLRAIAKDIEDLTTDLDVSYSSGRYVEFNPKGVNKGNGVLRLADILGIKPDEIIAIGDNFNDLSMIEAAGLGVGVQNTPDDMKPLCDVITQATYDQGAVAEVIEKYILGA